MKSGEPHQRGSDADAARAPEIVLSLDSDEARELWSTTLELARAFGSDEPWSLVGGLMVQLHAIERDARQRPTRDIDVLGNDRGRRRMTQRIAQILQGLKATLEDPSPVAPKVGFRFTLASGHVVDVLGPEGLKTPPKTIENRETFGIPGGSQALRRTEMVRVRLGGETAVVRRPNLLGAILIKGQGLMDRSSRRTEKIESDRRDLVLLLSFVEDPRAMREETTPKERKRLRQAATRLDIDAADLDGVMSASSLGDARIAFARLTS